MVKNNDKQFPEVHTAERREVLVRLRERPARESGDGRQRVARPAAASGQPRPLFAVEIVYAQKVGSLKSLSPREIALAAPQTDIQTTFAEWELYVPASHQLAKFGAT